MKELINNIKRSNLSNKDKMQIIEYINVIDTMIKDKNVPHVFTNDLNDRPTGIYAGEIYNIVKLEENPILKLEI